MIEVLINSSAKLDTAGYLTSRRWFEPTSNTAEDAICKPHEYASQSQDCPDLPETVKEDVMPRYSGSLETLSAKGSTTFRRVIERRSRELIERVSSHLMDDLSASDDVAPSEPAYAACDRLIRRISPHVALASQLKVAAFTEDNSGVSLMLQSLVTDRRMNLRIAPDGASISAICTDEHMDITIRCVREDDANLALELAEWVTRRT